MNNFPEPMDIDQPQEKIITRDQFMNLVLNNKSVLILKFGANWCRPCKTIEPNIETFKNKMPENMKLIIIDVDESKDIYSFLKSKKQINGIPVLLAYYKGNETFAPNDSVTGAHIGEINAFFERQLTNYNHIHKQLFNFNN